MKLTDIKSFFFTGLCFASILANTAIFNLGISGDGGVGIPLFWVFVFFLLPFVLIDFKHQFWIYLVFLNFLFLLVVTSNVDYSYSYLTQYVSRTLMFLIFLCFYFFKDINFSSVIKSTHWFLVSLSLLSVTAYFSLLFFNVDLALYNVANSASFGFRGEQLNTANGWARQLRLTGVWSEPSYLSIPVLMLVYLNNSFHTKLYWLVNALIVIMIIFSFSRSVWVAVALLFAFSIFRKSKILTTIFFKLRFTIIVMIFLLGSVGFILYGSIAGEDSSTTGRVGSAVVGSEMIKAHPFLGMGPGTFLKFKKESEFEVSHVDVTSENVIHSAFISIWQQFGILGWVIIFVPYYLLLKNMEYSHFYRVFPYVFSLPVVLVTSGDFTYFSYYWLFLGVLYKQNIFGDK